MYQRISLKQQVATVTVLYTGLVSTMRLRTMRKAMVAGLALLWFNGAPIASAAAPCCGVTNISRDGQVTAQETRGARTFQFQVADPAQLRTLRVGAPVYANFDTKQVSLDGKKPCCTILNISTTAKLTGPGTTSAVPRSTDSLAGAGTALPQSVFNVKFDPKKHGFEFTNYFTGDMLVEIPGIGTVNLGGTTYGLCGGMVFAALDTFKLGAVAPDVPTTPPPSGTPMRSFLYERQINSLKYEDGFLVRRLVAWMRKPLNDNTVPNPLAEGGVNVIERGLIHLSGKEFKSNIRPKLDAGNPVTIVLVKASGEDMVSNPKAAFSKNHQVLALGYSRHGDEWDIHIYDPNFPNTIQTLHTNGRHQTEKGATVHTGKFRGFFEAPYRLKRPPWVEDSPAVAGQVQSFKIAPFPRDDSDN